MEFTIVSHLSSALGGTAYNASCLLARCHRWRLRGGCQRWKFFRPSEVGNPHLKMLENWGLNLWWNMLNMVAICLGICTNNIYIRIDNYTVDICTWTLLSLEQKCMDSPIESKPMDVKRSEPLKQPNNSWNHLIIKRRICMISKTITKLQPAQNQTIFQFWHDPMVFPFWPKFLLHSHSFYTWPHHA